MNILYLNLYEEAMYLSATGYVNVHTFESNAQIPLKDVAIAITNESGDAIALRLTNRNGMLDKSIPISVPNLDESQTPNSPERPFSIINIYARKKNFEQIQVQNVQVFANTTTQQELEMIPLPEFPENQSLTEIFRVPPQNL